MCTSLRVRSADGTTLPLTLFTANVDIQLATAFVTLNADFKVEKNGTQVLEMPMSSRATTTSCSIESDKRTIQTCVVSKSELETYSASHKSFRQRTIKVDRTLFSIPFESRKKDNYLHVSLTYFETLLFNPDTGKYSFTLPCAFSDASKVGTTDIRASINATQFFQWSSVSHSLRIIQDVSATHKVFEVERWENRDFEISYSINTPDILGALLLNDAGIDPFDPRATFCVNLHPPPDSSLSCGFFGRRIMFLIDVSGSMAGEPIEQAKKALHTGLTQLRHFWDHFTIIAFNQSMTRWMDTVVEANPQSIEAALSWVARLTAGGGTEILDPLKAAVSVLTHPSFTDNRIPMVFLMTDGAVAEEQSIHAWLVQHCDKVRFHTLGIGDCCNAYFLKMISMAGRGLNDHVSDSAQLYQQVLAMLRSATTPILTNIEVLLPVQSQEYEVFPYPLPDLFCGQPLVISGKVSVPFDHALIRGLLPNGQVYQTALAPLLSPIHLHKIFVKQRLDYMIGQAWLSNSSEAIHSVVALSCQTGMASPYTVMVAYEVPKNKPKHNIKSNQPTIEEIAIMSVGGIILLVGLALTFGDVIGTVANVAVDMSMLSHAFGGGYGGGGSGGNSCGNCGNCNFDGCCNCCGHHHGGCCDCCGGHGGGCCNHDGGCCEVHNCCDGCGDCGGSGSCDCGSIDCGSCDCGGCNC